MTQTESREEIMESIAEINCYECPHYQEDIHVSSCICEPVMEMIHRECNVLTEDDETLCCLIWEKHRMTMVKIDE